jgi:hypothetical protein
MTEPTPDPAREAAGSYGDIFLPVPIAETPAASKPVPDESEAAMTRLRAPFDVEPADVPGSRG